MQNQLKAIESAMSGLINSLKELMKKMIKMKNVLCSFFIEIVKKKKNEFLEVFNQLISVECDCFSKENEKSSKSAKTVPNSKRKHEMNESMSNGKKTIKPKKRKNKSDKTTTKNNQ